MQRPGKVLVVSQVYAPDSSTTATYMTQIAEGLATNRRVVALSATPDSMSEGDEDQAKPKVIEVLSWMPRKDALVRRGIAMLLVAWRFFFPTLRRAKRDDIVFCVTTPFTLPFAVVLAAKLRGAATVLLIHDLYPEALEGAGLIKPSSLTARTIRLANLLLFQSLDAIITIGRDVEPLLLAYKGVTREKIKFIPNWTLLPVEFRERTADNQFRVGRHTQLIVGLSGNLGFTHSPLTVFEAARLLRDDPNIHFVLSGWGVGWKQLQDLQVSAPLPNITMLDPASQAQLAEFLSSADVWVIPYRRNIAGVSIPSRLYNLLAVGRAIIVAAEQHSEGALLVEEEGIGWVVPPEDAQQLANAIRLAASDRAATMQKGLHACVVAEKYSQDAALARYREVFRDVEAKRSNSNSE